MDAMLEEKLSVDDFWRHYVGDVSPLEFMNRLYSPDIDTCVETYVNELPDLFGIVRRHTWKDSFEAPTQFRRGEIAAAIVEKLEKSEGEWRPHLNQRPRVVAAPVPPTEAPSDEAPSDDVAATHASRSPEGDTFEPSLDAPADETTTEEPQA